NDVSAFRDFRKRVIPESLTILKSKNLEQAKVVVKRRSPAFDLETASDREVMARVEAYFNYDRQLLKDRLDGLEDYLPDDELDTHKKLVVSEYLPLFQKKPKDIDVKALDAKGAEVDKWLCTLSFEQTQNVSLGYRETLSSAIGKMASAGSDYTYAIEDDDPDAKSDATRAYVLAYMQVQKTRKELEKSSKQFSKFLNPTQAKELSRLFKVALTQVKAIQKNPQEDEAALADQVAEIDKHLNATGNYLKLVSKTAKKAIPAKAFYPALTYMRALEVFFLTLFVFVTVIIFLGYMGTYRPSFQSLFLFTVLPAFLCAFFWQRVNPPKNPPPESYYKGYAKNLGLKQKAAQKAMADGQSALSTGKVVFALIPFGENENVTIDAKVPPTWSESYAESRERLLNDSEKSKDVLLFETPSTWALTSEGGGERLQGAASFDLFGRDEASSATLRSFSLATAPFPGKFAKTADAWKKSLIKQDDDKRYFRVVPTQYGLAHAIVERSSDRSTSKISVFLDWKKDQGPADGPWAIEVEGPTRTVDSWWPKIQTYVASATSAMAGKVKSRLADKTRYHWLGTDQNGRDVAARMVYGSRVSLSVGFIAVAIYVFIGVFLGAIAGYFGGWTDIAISRVIEVVICFPSFFLIITVLAMLPPSIVNIMIVIGMTRWTGVARLIRGEFLRLVNLDFVVACRALGFSPLRTIFRHIVPNALAPVLVAATFGVAGAILTESALSYLGFGVPQPQASWGSILNEASEDPKQLWWITMFPGMAIFITITAYNIVGEAFRDASDPKLRK
ncbi:MAG: ABC transporter permease, partial [Planctomycetota bacterium]|nr:ABC transporter permease [Planctomycetota bacterium]